MSRGSRGRVEKWSGGGGDKHPELRVQPQHPKSDLNPPKVLGCSPGLWVTKTHPKSLLVIPKDPSPTGRHPWVLGRLHPHAGERGHSVPCIGAVLVTNRAVGADGGFVLFPEVACEGTVTPNRSWFWTRHILVSWERFREKWPPQNFPRWAE